MAHPLSGAAAIVGLGITPQGRVYGNTPVGFAVDAVQLALADAGLERKDLDGLLLNPGLAWADMGMGSFQLQQAMGLRDLRLSATMNLGGATACAMIQHAAQAIAAGLATTVACVFSDAPLKPERPEGQSSSSGSAYGFVRHVVSNGRRAVIVTGRDRARDSTTPPVYIRGTAHGPLGGDPSDPLSSGAVLSREPALRMAGLTLHDVDVVELYDCYTFTVL